MNDGLPAEPHDGVPFAAITATGSRLLTLLGRFAWKVMQALTSFSSKPVPGPDGLTNVVSQPTNENSATLKPSAFPAASNAGIQFPTKESPKITTVCFAVLEPYQHGTGFLAWLFTTYGSQE